MKILDLPQAPEAAAGSFHIPAGSDAVCSLSTLFGGAVPLPVKPLPGRFSPFLQHLAFPFPFAELTFHNTCPGEASFYT